jgi:exosortase family protein XrtM
MSSKPASTQSDSILTNKQFPLLFIAVNVILMGLYYSLPTTFIENSFVRFFAVVPGGALINWITPDVAVYTDHTRIISSIARLNVLKGCEGTEALLLLYAAMIAMLRPLRFTVMGLLLGTALVFVLNQARIVALFFIAAYQKDSFELVHGFIAPLLVIGAASLYFLLWLNWSSGNTAKAANQT